MYLGATEKQENRRIQERQKTAEGNKKDKTTEENKKDKKTQENKKDKKTQEITTTSYCQLLFIVCQQLCCVMLCARAASELYNTAWRGGTG